MRHMILLTTLAGVLSVAATQVQAQTVKNPRLLTFTCPDHALDTSHEIDIVDSKGVVVQTIQAGDPPLNAKGEVEVVLNVQPVTFGTYTIVGRAVAGDLKSANSVPSDVWERVPGAPGKARVGG